jgi:hypothetical protein
MVTSNTHGRNEIIYYPKMCVLSARTLLTMHVGWGRVRCGGVVPGGGFPPYIFLPLLVHTTPLGLAQKSIVNLLYLSGLDCWAFLLLLTCMGPFELCLLCRKQESKE